MSIEKLRELETLASVCPELNMANYTEDDVRHLNDWAIEMSLLVERYALSQQPDNAACKSVQKRFAAQQPATGEPVKATPYNPTEEMRWAMKRIDPALSSEQCRALWSAAWYAAPFSTTPQPAQATQAEVTDAAIDAATRHIYHNGRPTSKEYRVGITRTILALRPERVPMTERELELIDGMIAVQLDHAQRCDAISNRAMAEKQKGWDMERVELLRRIRSFGITAQARRETP